MRYMVNDVFETVFINENEWIEFNWDADTNEIFKSSDCKSEEYNNFVRGLYKKADEITIESLEKISDCKPLIEYLRKENRQ